jgi:hypothetical protein
MDITCMWLMEHECIWLAMYVSFLYAGGIRAVTHVDVTNDECLAFTRAFRTILETAQ